jgi:Holliday junction DNA helicase RuvB
VDKKGLDRLDRSVLEALITKFGGGPVGLSTLAIAVGEETETVETVAEPFLVREGLLGRTPRGRIAMAPAWTHLGYAIPSGVFGQEPLDLFETAGGEAEGTAGWAPESQ